MWLYFSSEKFMSEGDVLFPAWPRRLDNPALLARVDRELRKLWHVVETFDPIVTALNQGYPHFAALRNKVVCIIFRVWNAFFVDLDLIVLRAVKRFHNCSILGKV